MEMPEMLELAWGRAYPGREAAERNELMRQLHEELAGFDPPQG
jgi:hypothetical protein